MFIRQTYKMKNGRRHAYWALVESYRTERGPRQRVVSWLGSLDEAGRLGIEQAADGHAQRTSLQLPLFEYDDTPTEPRWVEVNTGAIRVENCREFGGPWLAMQVIERFEARQVFWMSI